MKTFTWIGKLARRGAAALLLLAMLALSTNDAAGQVECIDPGVAEGTLELATLASGAQVVESGAGLYETGSGTATVDIPAGATIVDAYVYWSVRQAVGEPDGRIDITVNGGSTESVEGDCIGFDPEGGIGAPAATGTVYAFKSAFPTADLAVGSGNTVTVDLIDTGVDRADGFSAVILYTTDSSIGYSQFYEGADFIWGPNVQVSSTLTFEGDVLGQCVGNDLTLHLKVGDTTPDRPNRLRIDIGGSNVLEEYRFFGDPAFGWEPQWSDREVVIGAADYEAGSSIEVELASVKENSSDPAPSSLSWIVGGVTCSVPTTEITGCTRTPGYWRNQGFRSGVLTTALASAKIQFPDAFDGDPWAASLSVNDARSILNQNSCSDIGYCLEKHLLASILNAANGATNTIASTINDAIDYLDSGAAVDAEELKNTLDRFNNGLEGPPSCDSLEEERIESASAQNRTLRHSVGPNPFNPTTQIHFELGESMPVKLGVYDVLGREVRILIDGVVNAGEHRVHFDANGLPTGTYFYRFVTPQGAFGGQMLLIK